MILYMMKSLLLFFVCEVETGIFVYENVTDVWLCEKDLFMCESETFIFGHENETDVCLC